MTLRALFDNHDGQPVAKIDHFFDDYEPILEGIRRPATRILEIGIDGGGSLELWRRYFGDDAVIVGLDIETAAAGGAPADVVTYVGSQTDTALLGSIVSRHGPFDLVIDDASHMVSHQIATFEFLYPTLASEGVYICEDSFTSYWPEYGGRLGSADSFVEFAKRKVDELHGWWAPEDIEVSDFTRTTRSISFLSGATVFVRGERTPPTYVYRAGESRYDMSVEHLHNAARRTLGEGDQSEPH